MATTLFDLVVTVSTAGTAKGLSSDAKASLFRKPRLEKDKPKLAGSVERAAAEGAPVEEPLTITEISQAYGEIIERADGLLDRLKDRLKDLTYTFNPNEIPELANAVGSIFQNENKQITYRMYLAALRLDKDIAIELGESESVTI
jgi:hypothetical protein